MIKKVPAMNVAIKNESNDVAIIDIEGAIGEDWWSDPDEQNTSSNIKKKLAEIANLGASKIVVNINSLGGYVNDGLAIHDALAQHPAEVETVVYGFTASAATIIAQAGDIRKMSDNALYLVHEAWGFHMGNKTQLLESIDALEKIDNTLAKIYAKRSGKDIKEIYDLMNANSGDGRWLDSDEAMEYGLIDEVVEPTMKAAAAVSAGTLQNMGLPVPATLKNKQPEEDELTKALRKAGITAGKRFEYTAENGIRVLDTEHSEEMPDGAGQESVPGEGIRLAEAKQRELQLIIKGR